MILREDRVREARPRAAGIDRMISARPPPSGIFTLPKALARLARVFGLFLDYLVKALRHLTGLF